MRLTFDLPINYNDFSKGEVADLYLKLKKLVDELSVILGNISEENLSIPLKEKINAAFGNSQKALDEINKMKEES